MTHEQLSQASVTALAQLRARGEAEWIGIEDACRVLNVSRERATQLAVRGDVVAQKMGKHETSRWQFYIVSLWEYNERRVKQAQDEHAVIEHVRRVA